MKIAFCSLVLCLGVLLYGRGFSSPASQQTPPKVAIVPFTTGGQENIDYIADGLRDMIASRIAAGSAVEIVGQNKVAVQMPRTGKEALVPEKLREAGRALGADYVIFGSMAKMGDGLIISINMLSVSSAGTPVPVFARTLVLDEVIPRMQLVAQEIREGIENRLQTPKEAPAGIPSLGESPGKGEAGTAPGTSVPGDVLLQGGGEAGAALPSLPEGESEGDGGAESSDQSQKPPQGLKQLLLERKVDSDPAPENPVYQESLEELQKGDGQTR